MIQPKRDEAAKLGGQVTSLKTQLDSARADLVAGQTARSTFGGSYSALVRLGEAVPADDNVPSLIFQIQGAASKAHVDFRTLTLNAGATGGSAIVSTTITSASATQSATAALPPGATVGSAGFPIEPFNFTFQGSFFHLADFLGRIEKFVVATNNHFAISGRLLTLNAISLAPGPKGFPQITATISADTYLVPAEQGVLNGATASGPSGSSASSGTQTASVQTPSTQTSSSPAPTAAVVAAGGVR